MLGAGVREPGRWRQPVGICPRGANFAWSVPSGSREETENPQVPTEIPKEATQAEEWFEPEKEWMRVATRTWKAKMTLEAKSCESNKIPKTKACMYRGDSRINKKAFGITSTEHHEDHISGKG